MATQLRHGLFWVVIYIIWTYLKSGGGFSILVALETLLNMFVYISVFYALYNYMIPQFYAKGKMMRFGVSIVSLITAVYVFWRIIGALELQQILLDAYLLEMVQSFVPAMILLAIESHGDQFRQRDKITALEKEKLASELKVLKSQINPQFLLGTLSNLYDNVIKKSTRAPEIIMLLSKVLDYVLYRSQNELVPIHEEVAVIRSFVTLEEIRFEGRLQVIWMATSELMTLISPLVLLDVTQYLFRSIEQVEGDITMELNIGDSNNSIIYSIKYLVEEQCHKKNNDLRTEICRQVDLVYPNLYDLSITDQGNGMRIILTIKAMV